MDASLAARACARAGLPWEDALIVSAHELRRAVNTCRAHPKVAVLTVPGAGPAELARALFPQTPRSFIVCEDLGGPDERAVHVRPAEATTRPWNDPQVVLVLDDRRPPEPLTWTTHKPGPATWALDTLPPPPTPPPFGGGAMSSGVDGPPRGVGAPPSGGVLAPLGRAFALARLGPRTGDMVWDLGSSGGAIAVECARFGAAAVAVGTDAASCDRVQAAVRAHRVRVAVSRGTLPSVLDHLPDPDAVFLADAAPDSIRACAARALHRLVATADESRVPQILDVLAEAGFAAEAATFHTTPLGAQAEPPPPATLVWAHRARAGPAASPAERARPVERTPPL